MHCPLVKWLQGQLECGLSSASLSSPWCISLACKGGYYWYPLGTTTGVRCQSSHRREPACPFDQSCFVSGVASTTACFSLVSRGFFPGWSEHPRQEKCPMRLEMTCSARLFHSPSGFKKVAWVYSTVRLTTWSLTSLVPKSEGGGKKQPSGNTPKASVQGVCQL